MPALHIQPKEKSCCNENRSPLSDECAIVYWEFFDAVGKVMAICRTGPVRCNPAIVDTERKVGVVSRDWLKFLALLCLSYPTEAGRSLTSVCFCWHRALLLDRDAAPKTERADPKVPVKKRRPG